MKSTFSGSDTRPNLQLVDTPANWPVVAVLLMVFCAFASLAYFFDGSISDDDRAHYLIARYSWSYPELLLDLWGRPAYTLLSSPFAQFGIRAAGVFNVLVSLASCYVAFAIAQALGLTRPWLAAAFTAVQPLFVLLSVGTLTEPLFSLLLAASVLFYLRDNFVKSALCMSLLPMARLEGFAFIALWTLLLLWRGRWKAAACLAVFPLLVNTAGFLASGEPLFLLRYNPYGTGGGVPSNPWMWWDYVVRWPTVTGPLLLPLITLGLLCAVEIRKWLVSAVTAALVGLYFVAYTRGAAADITKDQVIALRLFVSAAPLLGVLATQGIHYLFAHSQSRTRRVILPLVGLQALMFTWWWAMPGSYLGRLHLVTTWLVVLAVVGRAALSSPRLRSVVETGFIGLALLIAGVHLVRWWPLQGPPSVVDVMLSDTADWFQSSDWKGRPVVAITPRFWMRSRKDPYETSYAVGYKAFGRGYEDLVREAAPGTVIVWDTQRFSGVPLDAFSPREFRVIRSFSTSDDPEDRYFHRGQAPFRVVVFEKVS